MSKSLKKLIDINRLREFKNKLVGAGSAYVQTAAVDQTVAGTKTFSKPIVGSVTGSSGSCTGNAATATQFSANKSVTLTGDVTGTASSKAGWSVATTLANSGVTAGSYGPTADVTGNNNATISVPQITVDAKGRVTSVVNRTLTCKNNTYNVYNKTLTIQKNGTNVATFTSNSNTDVAANITVPTKVSELTNDSGFLTSHQSLSNYVTLNGAQTISGAKTFTGDIIGINKERSTEDANSLYSTTAGSKLTYYTTSNGGTDLANVPATVNTTLESRTIRRLSDSDWIVEQICHNSNGLYYRKGSNGTWGAWKTFAFTDSNISGNAATATKATGNANGKELTNTIIKGLSISGKTITYTQIDGNTGTLTTQDTVYTHPTTAGNKHIPSGGSSGQFLGWASDGTAKWVNNPNTNTDTLMTQNVSTTNATYPVLLVATADATANQGAKTGIFAKSVKVNPSTNVISASGFSGPLTGNVTGNCSGSSGSCTGNAATATKLATARTIALSGAATGTATGFDGSGDITIPVTALSSSAIRAQWYAAYPDGAEAHNAMWGGRDITAAFNAGTVSANIADGTFKDIFPGDYITKRVTISGTAYTVNWVIADCDYWINKGDNPAVTAHHVVIVPQAPIFSANMNATNTTEGGYAGSRMYRETIPACATGIVNAFGASHILTFRDHLTRDLNTSVVSSGITVFTGAPNWNGAWYSQQCNLMSEAMVYDGPHCASSALDNIMATRQMSAFRLSERLINYNRNNWWLRDVVSSAHFAGVHGYGLASTHLASGSYGVRPFALLV